MTDSEYYFEQAVNKSIVALDAGYPTEPEEPEVCLVHVLYATRLDNRSSSVVMVTKDSERAFKVCRELNAIRNGHEYDVVTMPVT